MEVFIMYSTTPATSNTVKAILYISKESYMFQHGMRIVKILISMRDRKIITT
jgi:hypothetical protein